MAMPLMMTSCEGTLDDIFGEWSRPGSQPTKEEVLDNLSSALEEGAVITITYTLDGVKYTSTLKKQGDEFIELSPAAAATRAMTRSLAHPVCSGMVVIAKNILIFKFYNNEQLKLDVSVKVETCEMVTNYASSGSEILGAYVNGQQANLKKPSNYSSIEIWSRIGYTAWKTANFDVKKGETWVDFSRRIKYLSNQIHFEITSDAVCFTCIDERDVQKGVLCHDDNTYIKVLPSDVVGEYQSYYLIQYIPVSCTERSWDETNNKVETSDKTFNDCKVVLSSDESVKWEAGTYVVDHDVTIDGTISCDGDVNLILCDGCTLTLSNEINGRKKSFTIYGQTAGSGKLISTYMGHGLCNFSDFVIHGGNIETSSVVCNDLSNLKMYGGKFSAKVNSSDPVIKTRVGKNMTIYGGELDAVSNGTNAIIVGDDNNPGTLTVYGGKVIASAPKGQAIKGKFAKGEGTVNGYNAYFAAEGTVNALRIVIEGEEATGIEAIDNSQLTNGNEPIFNLNGQRLEQKQRGVNIVGGRKIVVK